VRGLRNPLKPLDLLPPEAEERVHEASMRLLRDQGMVFEEERALDLFRRAGQKVDDGEQRVFLDPDFVIETAARAPSQFLLEARDPDWNVTIGDDSIVFAPVSGPPDGLSPREVQILALIARGLSNREIGRTLSISEHTAANHIRSILRKTGCSNRTEAASYAHRHRLASI